MIVYLLQITLNLVLTYIVYKWVLEHIKTYRFNRFYLLFSIVLSLLLPLISINYNTSFSELQTSITEISEVIIKQEEAAMQTTTLLFNWTTLVYGIYFLGLGIGLFKFSRGLYILTSLKKQGKQILENGQCFVLLAHVKHPFTFGKTIYLSKTPR